MASLGNFDATTVEPNGRPDAMPAGKYKAIAIDSEFKDTKSGNGKYLQFCFEIVEGPFKGRRVWDRLNLVNANQQAVDIARRTLSAICHACGVMQPKDSSQLHNIPMVVKVGLRKNEGEDVNEVKGYEKIATQSQQPARQVAAAATPEKAPWE